MFWNLPTFSSKETCGIEDTLVSAGESETPDSEVLAEESGWSTSVKTSLVWQALADKSVVTFLMQSISMSWGPLSFLLRDLFPWDFKTWTSNHHARSEIFKGNLTFLWYRPLTFKVPKRVSHPCSCKEYELKTLMSKAQMTTFLMTTLVWPTLQLPVHQKTLLQNHFLTHSVEDYALQMMTLQSQPHFQNWFTTHASSWQLSSWIVPRWPPGPTRCSAGISTHLILSVLFFFGQCCARCNNRGSHGVMLN